MQFNVDIFRISFINAYGESLGSYMEQKKHCSKFDLTDSQIQVINNDKSYHLKFNCYDVTTNKTAL